jgi:hypothetical protein
MTEPAEATPLMTYLLAVLATLMAPSLGDLQLAHRAAQEAIDTRQTRTPADPMTTARSLAFAVTALDNLCLSMPADLSLAMKLRLRGNANALNRSAGDTTHIPRTAETPAPDLAEQAAITGWDQPETPPPARSTEPNDPIGLAAAMKTVAARLQTTTTASPAQQKVNALWASTLTQVAGEIALGKFPPPRPGQSRADLLRTTLMASGQEFPAQTPK